MQSTLHPAFSSQVPATPVAVLVQRGRYFAELTGEVLFPDGYRLNGYERPSTDPHHKRIPPDIKHHRIPAPGLNFTEPNLPFLIREMESAVFRD